MKTRRKVVKTPAKGKRSSIICVKKSPIARRNPRRNNKNKNKAAKLATYDSPLKHIYNNGPVNSPSTSESPIKKEQVKEESIEEDDQEETENLNCNVNSIISTNRIKFEDKKIKKLEKVVEASVDREEIIERLQDNDNDEDVVNTSQPSTSSKRKKRNIFTMIMSGESPRRHKKRKLKKSPLSRFNDDNSKSDSTQESNTFSDSIILVDDSDFKPFKHHIPDLEIVDADFKPLLPSSSNSKSDLKMGDSVVIPEIKGEQIKLVKSSANSTPQTNVDDKSKSSAFTKSVSNTEDIVVIEAFNDSSLMEMEDYHNHFNQSAVDSPPPNCDLMDSIIVIDADDDPPVRTTTSVRSCPVTCVPTNTARFTSTNLLSCLSSNSVRFTSTNSAPCSSASSARFTSTNSVPCTSTNSTRFTSTNSIPSTSSTNSTRFTSTNSVPSISSTNSTRFTSTNSVPSTPTNSTRFTSMSSVPCTSKSSASKPNEDCFVVWSSLPKPSTSNSVPKTETKPWNTNSYTNNNSDILKQDKILLDTVPEYSNLRFLNNENNKPAKRKVEKSPKPFTKEVKRSFSNLRLDNVTKPVTKTISKPAIKTLTKSTVTTVKKRAKNNGELIFLSETIREEDEASKKKTKSKNGKLREIVIDGQNVACAYTHNGLFSEKGIKMLIDYFTKKGHTVKVFVPQHRRSRVFPLLEKWHSEGIVVFTPSRKLGTKSITSYDDRYILEYATACNGIVVSQDQFRDLYAEKPQYRDTIENRLLVPTFVGDYVMFPEDPLGRDGPTLTTFLKH